MDTLSVRERCTRLDEFFRLALERNRDRLPALGPALVRDLKLNQEIMNQPSNEAEVALADCAYLPHRDGFMDPTKLAPFIVLRLFDLPCCVQYSLLLLYH